MTQQQINHKIARFDGWTLAKGGTYYYKGPLDNYNVVKVEKMNYHLDWNLAHSAWVAFRRLKCVSPDYGLWILELEKNLILHETPQLFAENLYAFLQWYKNLKIKK